MRRYLDEWLLRDPRIRIAPGDPLPSLELADVCVHPSYTDGCGYAPLEAMACGVPVIVTEDTGMKEHVCEGVNGFVIPTGDWRSLLDRLEYLRSIG
jgi:glycosyltransferase involved in cell wall biosynthesis